MSAARLREAATSMRSRAEAALPVPWDHLGGGLVACWVDGYGQADICDARRKSDAEHIASWHPAVAIAVADWLDAKAEQDDKGTCDDPRGCCTLCEHDYGHIAALAVANAYLGSDS